MAAPPPISPPSLSSEITAKPHPYQQHDDERTKNGPKGAFEARKLKRGLYVRVDMPGVPNNGVKVVKYNETRTITFSGKATSIWPGFDSPEPRVYAGYVVLDRDPSNVDFTFEVENGVFRMFFPRCDGSLHFLSPPRRNSSGAAQHDDDDDDSSGQDEQVIIPTEDNISFILHSPLEPYELLLIVKDEFQCCSNISSYVRNCVVRFPSLDGNCVVPLRLVKNSV